MTTAPRWIGVAFSAPTELCYALFVRQAGPATPLDAETDAPSGLLVFWAVTSLTIPVVARPDRGAVISVAKAIPAFAILGASSLRHVLGQRSRRTHLGDRPIEGGKRSHRRREIRILFGSRRTCRRRSWVSGRFYAFSSWRRIAGRAGGYSGDAQHRKETQKPMSPTHVFHVPYHGYFVHRGL
jgi:hypothetical protein